MGKKLPADNDLFLFSHQTTGFLHRNCVISYAKPAQRLRSSACSLEFCMALSAFPIANRHCMEDDIPVPFHSSKNVIQAGYSKT